MQARGQSNRPPMGQESTIRLNKITPFGTGLVCSFTYGTRLEPYLNSSVLYFNYDFPVEEIPMSVLSIPVLGVLSPLAWVTGTTIVGQEVDDHYVSSLQKVAEVMQGMYPGIRISSRVECTKVTTRWMADPFRVCLLYSGGVDSTASLLRNLGPKLSVASVRGPPDLRLWEGEYWDRVEQKLSPFVRSLGVERHIVETNALDVLNFSALSESLKSSFTWGWWENLAHGLTLLSLCAPLTYHQKIGKMMIASTYSQADYEPWGSTTDSDQKIGWGDLTTVHDSFDLTRLQKVSDILLPYMTKHPGAVQLRVCTGKREARLASGAMNCGKCEKCARTMLVLLAAGADPAECGFPPPDLVRFKDGLISGRLRNPSGFTLRSLKAAKIPPRPDLVSRYPGLEEFFAWFYNWETPPFARRRGILTRLAPDGTRRRRLIAALLGPPG